MTTRDRIELLLLGMIWGASFLFMRVAVPEFGTMALVEIRVAVAALFLVAVLAWRGGMGDLRSAKGPLVIVGVLSSALPFALFAYATLYVTAGTAAVLNASAPLFGALVAYAWLKDRLTVPRVIGLAIGFGGVLLLAWDKIAFNGGGTTLAILAGIGASLSYGISVNYTKRKLAHLPPLAAATGSQIAATLLLLPLAVANWPSVAPSLKSWLCVIALGVFCTGVAFHIYFRLIAHIGPAKAITVTYLIPVFGMLWGLMILSEAITAGMVIACAVILLGTALATGSVAIPGRKDARSEKVSQA
jgi:drug/metabolite transporter (DMT)-like permease